MFKLLETKELANKNIQNTYKEIEVLGLVIYSKYFFGYLKTKRKFISYLDQKRNHYLQQNNIIYQKITNDNFQNGDLKIKSINSLNYKKAMHIIEKENLIKVRLSFQINKRPKSKINFHDNYKIFMKNNDYFNMTNIIKSKNCSHFKNFTPSFLHCNYNLVKMFLFDE